MHLVFRDNPQISGHKSHMSASELANALLFLGGAAFELVCSCCFTGLAELELDASGFTNWTKSCWLTNWTLCFALGAKTGP